MLSTHLGEEFNKIKGLKKMMILIANKLWTPVHIVRAERAPAL